MAAVLANLRRFIGQSEDAAGMAGRYLPVIIAITAAQNARQGDVAAPGL